MRFGYYSDLIYVNALDKTIIYETIKSNAIEQGACEVTGRQVKCAYFMWEKHHDQ